MTLSTNDSETVSSTTDGECGGNLNKTESGVEFGFRKRRPGVLWFKDWPHPEIIRKLVSDQRYCVGIDSIDGVSYRRFEKRDNKKKA